MRWFAVLVLALALGVMGCSETPSDGSGGDGNGGVSGTGGVSGSGGIAGRGGETICYEPCAGGGFGGGCYGAMISGLWSGWDSGRTPIPGGPQLSSFVRFDIGRDCMSLVETSECPMDGLEAIAALFEIAFEGLDEEDMLCSGGIAITSSSAAEVTLLGTNLYIETIGDGGATWLIEGSFYGDFAYGSVNRTDESGYCEGGWGAEPGCRF